MPKDFKNMKTLKKIISLLSIYGITTSANAEALNIPFLQTVWDTFTQVGLPILFGLGILGAFVADRHDSETGKRVLLTVAILAIAVKVTLAFLAWTKTSFAGA